MYIWSTDFEKHGSLILGNRAADPEKDEKEATVKGAKRVTRRGTAWKITIDKETRFKRELLEAEELLHKVDKIDYDQMKQQAEIKRKLAESSENGGVSAIENQLSPVFG